MLTELDLKCLWAIADDYEEIPMIKEMLKQMMETHESAHDIARSLHNLITSKFAQAYEYDESKADFAKVEFPYEKALLPSAEDTWQPGMKTDGRVYFYITQTGKDFLKGKTSPCR
jgi:hypothetical protein